MAYSIARLHRLSQRPDTAAETAARKERIRKWAQIAKETLEKYPVVTPENFRDIENFQRARHIELFGQPHD